MAGVVQEHQLEKQIEKQIGCMAGFFQIFDRNQILAGKRLHSAKCLPPPALADSAPEPEKSIASQRKISPETEKQFESRSTMPSQDKLKQSPLPGFSTPEVLALPCVTPSKSPVPLSSSWKFGKETPRLSLDSRATVDAKGRLKPRELRTNGAMNRQKTGSSSVIAKLMGLELLPKSDLEPAEEQPELRRSASESRDNRDLPQYRFIDGVNFQLKQPSQAKQNVQSCNPQNSTVRNVAVKNQLGIQKDCNAVRHSRVDRQQPNRAIAGGQRKSFYDSADFFPEPKQQAAVSIYGEIEKRLRMRGIDEPSKDLETLKQILEALQLKGLLHSKNPQTKGQINSRRSFDDSPIVVMKPARSISPVSRPAGRIGIGSESPPASFRTRAGHRRDSSWSNESLPAMSPRRDRPESDRNARARGKNCSSPTRSESGGAKPLRRRPLSVEAQRRIGNETVEQRRVSPVQSPKIGSRRSGPDQSTNQSPRRRPAKDDSKVYNAAAEDESSTVSESSLSANSQSEAERSKDGKNILDRCDKLLHSIAEMTAATAELQPSPVSVLDSSFYRDESSPSPVMKRNVDFKGQIVKSEEDMWSPTATGSAESDDCEFTYVSDILRASSYLPGDSDVFLLLEKQQRLRGKDTSKLSRLQRRLIFDTINEILKKKRELPPWKAVVNYSSSSETTCLNQIWSEFQRIQARDDSSSSEDVFEVICSVLRKDLAGDAVSGWDDCHVEMSEVVLDIERLVFKDLIGETIRDLANFSGRGQTQMATASRRKLDF